MIDASTVWSTFGSFYHKVPLGDVAWVRLSNDMGYWVL